MHRGKGEAFTIPESVVVVVLSFVFIELEDWVLAVCLSKYSYPRTNEAADLFPDLASEFCYYMKTVFWEGKYFWSDLFNGGEFIACVEDRWKFALFSYQIPMFG